MSKLVTKNDLKAIFEEMVTIDGADMTSQEVDNFVDSLDITGINAVDYVVEQGTDNGWTYRKWNSGRMEADKDMVVGSTWTQVASTGVYYASADIVPPTGMTLITGFVSLRTSTSIYFLGGQVQVASPTSVVMCHRLSGSTANMNIHVTIIGTSS